MRKTGKFLALVLCVLVFSAMAMGSGSSESKSGTAEKVGEVTVEAPETGAQSEQLPKAEKTEAPVEPTPEAKTEYYVGDTLSDDGLQITFVSSSFYTSDNQFNTPAEGNRFIRLCFHVENQSDSDRSISLYDFNCYADGYECESTYADDDLSASLSHGRSADGAVYFEVPKDAAEIEVEYEINWFSDKRVKFIFEGERDSGFTAEKNTNPSENAFHVGDIIETGDLRIIYANAAEEISDNIFLQPAEGNQYIYLEFEVENISDSDQSISYFSFDCYADGMQCDGYYGRDDELSAELSAGRKAKGTVAFEVPKDAAVIEIEYEDNVWTDSRIIFAYEG